MSLGCPSEPLAEFHDDARRVAEYAAHEEDLELLVASAEGAMREAHEALLLAPGVLRLRHVLRAQSTRDTRFIAYTANAAIDHCLGQEWFAGVLQKPATPALATVRHAASR